MARQSTGGAAPSRAGRRCATMPGMHGPAKRRRPAARRHRTSSSTGPRGPRWAQATEQPLSADEIERVRGLGDELDLDEVAAGLPAAVPAAEHVRRERRPSTARRGASFDEPQPPRTPFVIGLAGSVAVGKSTTARVLQQMLAHWPEHPSVSLVTTDGFLYPNAELERRGLLARKGFPESYDRRALLRFVMDIKSGGRGGGADVLPPGLRRGARREGRDQAPRHRDHRGAQRAPAGAGPRRRQHRAWRSATSSTSRSTSTPPPPTSGAGTSTGSCGCGRPPSATLRRTSRRYAELTEERGGPRGRPDLGHHQRPQPEAERPAHPRPRHPGAAQGRRPLGALRPAAQALISHGRRRPTAAGLRLLSELPSRSDRPEAERHVDRNHVGVDLGVPGQQAAHIGPLPLQPEQGLAP